MIETVKSVVAPIGKVPRYKLWTGCRSIRCQIPGNTMYLAALSTVKSTNNARLRKKNTRENSFMICELVSYGKL